MKSRWVPVALGTLIVGAVIFAIIGGLMQPTPQKKMSANQIEVPKVTGSPRWPPV